MSSWFLKQCFQVFPIQELLAHFERKAVYFFSSTSFENFQVNRRDQIELWNILKYFGLKSEHIETFLTDVCSFNYSSHVLFFDHYGWECSKFGSNRFQI